MVNATCCSSESVLGVLVTPRVCLHAAGFDPLRLGVDSDRMKWFREGELTNGRWAMAAVVGILFTELVRGLQHHTTSRGHVPHAQAVAVGWWEQNAGSVQPVITRQWDARSAGWSAQVVVGRC